MIVRLQFLLISFALWGCSQAIHHISVTGDTRQSFQLVKSFGFGDRGTMNFSLSAFQFASESAVGTAGFHIKHSMTLGDSVRDHLNCDSVVDQVANDNVIVLSAVLSNDSVWGIKLMRNPSNASLEMWSTGFTLRIGQHNQGFYAVHFFNCHRLPVIFTASVEEYNIAENHRSALSVGLYPLPAMYFAVSAVYCVILCFWVAIVKKFWNQVNKVHVLMLMFVVVKMLAVLFHGVQYMSLYKDKDIPGWNILYYIFYFIRSALLVTVLALIAAGLSFVKPYLSSREKIIVLTLIPLQMLAVVAQIVSEQLEMGSIFEHGWLELFKVLDIVCAFAILIPVMWSLKHLREAARKGEKVAVSLQKIRLFRNFYIAFIMYMYITRLLTMMLESTLPYTVTWLMVDAGFLNEFCTLCFVVLVGWNFRPMSDNPYFRVPRNEEEEEIMLQDLRMDLADVEDAV